MMYSLFFVFQYKKKKKKNAGWGVGDEYGHIFLPDISIPVLKLVFNDVAIPVCVPCNIADQQEVYKELRPFATFLWHFTVSRPTALVKLQLKYETILLKLAMTDLCNWVIHSKLKA